MPATLPPPDLEYLLAESLSLRDAEREARDARARLHARSSSGRTPDEVAADEARVREWELRHEWQAVAAVALFEKYKCLHCGRGQTVFRQMMLKQAHRRLPDTWRWQQVDEAPDGLPAEIQVQKWQTGMCTHCSAEFGFDFAAAPVSEWQS